MFYGGSEYIVSLAILHVHKKYLWDKRLKRGRLGGGAIFNSGA